MTGSFIKSGYSDRKANLSTNKELISFERTTDRWCDVFVLDVSMTYKYNPLYDVQTRDGLTFVRIALKTTFGNGHQLKRRRNKEDIKKPENSDLILKHVKYTSGVKKQ
jgi:hypothetical protein